MGNGVKDREGESGDDVCWIDGGNGGRQLESMIFADAQSENGRVAENLDIGLTLKILFECTRKSLEAVFERID